MKRSILKSFSIAAVAVWASSPAHAQKAAPPVETRALIIGIDDYQFVPHLKGAIADARDLEGAIRGIGARDVHMLLDAAATRGTVLLEFQNLVARTQRGDTVFIAISGHGAQEPERVPGSQPDGMDAVFLLPGFDPKDDARYSEKILNNEFNHFIKGIEEKGARVVFIADTCSGGGLARSVDSRGEEMSYRAIKYPPRQDNLTPVATRADAMMATTDFAASNFLAAVDRQSKAPEIRVPGIGYRGALSYSIARGLEGAADLNGDGEITAAELFEYAHRVTYQLSDQRQQIVTAAAEGKDASKDVIVSFDRGIAVRPTNPDKPAGAPAGPITTARPVPAASPAAAARPQAKPVSSPAANAGGPVRVASLDGQGARFTGLSLQIPYEVVAPTANPDLVWDPASRDALSGGDVIAHNVDRNDLPSVIERTAAVRWLKMRAAQGPQALRIVPDDKLHRKGARVEIEVSNLSGRSLILFNLAGDGTVQMLYPLGSDPPVRTEDSYRVQLQVREPLGADQIVAVTSSRRLGELEQAIRQLDRKRNPMKISDAVNQFAAGDVLVGFAGLFTAP